MSNLSITDVTKKFPKQNHPAVDGFSLELAQGELVVLLGPSGCGKTTLLRCIAGLERPDAGRIAFGNSTVFDSAGGKEIPTHKRDFGMVFQNYALWPHMTVGQNVAYPMRARGWSKARIAENVATALALVECSPYIDRYPADLSGGQQQRIALARAMAANPAVMLFDEPLSNLDFRLRAQLRQDIRSLHRTAGFTGVYVTHDQTEALQIGDRVVVMNAGRPAQVDTPVEVFSRPASPYVARFLGIGNSVKLRFNTARRLWSVADTAEDLTMDLGERGEGLYELFVRPSDIELLPGGEETAGAMVTFAEGTVLDVVYSGESSEWIIDFGWATWSAVAPGRTWPFRPGDRVTAAFNRSAALLYASDDAAVASDAGMLVS